MIQITLNTQIVYGLCLGLAPLMVWKLETEENRENLRDLCGKL